MEPVKAWWFSKGYELPHSDERPIKLGETHAVEGELELCYRGLHASINILDALGYAPGPILWQVELSGIVVHGKDKLCASKRKYIGGGIDISDVLGQFARTCALDVAHLWNCPKDALQYLKTGDKKLRSAAWSAAWSAVWSASRSAAEDAAENAWSAARAAARSAAMSAARSATDRGVAMSAAEDARSAARSAGMSAGMSAAEYAAEYAAEDARSAAEYATRKEQNERLTEMVMKVIG